jgi:hypothetical protein
MLKFMHQFWAKKLKHMSQNQPQQLPSERRFGLLFTAVFAVVGIYANLKGWNQTTVFSLVGLSGLIALITLSVPKLLAPFNRLWFELGQLMGRIVSPIVLGAIFFLILTPVALVTRLFGRDELRLKRKAATSYWIDRTNENSPAETFKNQF